MKDSEAQAEQLPTAGTRDELGAIQFLGWAVFTIMYVAPNLHGAGLKCPRGHQVG